MSDVPEGVVVAPTERSTSNMSNTLRANNFAFLLASLLSYIAAAFIVLTGLTTNVIFNGFVAVMNNIYDGTNASTRPGITQPAAAERTG